MKCRRPSLARAVIWFAAAAASAALLAPWIRADRFRGRIEGALEEALRRDVEIAGPVRFQLWPAPGFAAEDVVIADDPAIGIEPLAYVGSLSIAVRTGALLRRRLEVSRLRLYEPSVNLVKTASQQWNFPSLLERAFAPGRRRPAVPSIQVRSGRLNFKFGDVKSVFYFAGADLDIEPDRPSGAVRVRFAGVMARTDRPPAGVGRLSGRGRFLAPPGQETRLELNLHLERSSIPEILALLQGRRPGLGGFLTSTARLEGPLSDLEILGALQLTGVTGGLLPLGRERWALDYRGKLDLNAQKLLIDSRPGAAESMPVWFRFRVSSYLSEPRWAVGLGVRRLPVDSLPALARELGAALAPGLTLRGVASGALSWSAGRGLQGQLLIEDGEVGWAGPGLETVRFAALPLLVLGDRVRLLPAELRLADNETVTAELIRGGAANRHEVRLRTEGVPIRRLLDLWRRLDGSPPPAILAACDGGVFEGVLGFRAAGQAEGVWEGSGLLRDAVIRLEGLSRPVEIGAAGLSLGRAGRLRLLTARAGGIAFTGEYRHVPRSPRPHSLWIRAERLDVARLAELFGPILRPRRRTLLARTLRLGPPPAPAWLERRRAEVQAEIAVLEAGPYEIDSIETRAYWHGAQIELVSLKARGRGAAITGRLVIELGRADPVLLGRLAVAGLRLGEGKFSLDARFRTAAAGAQWLERLSADGSFSGGPLTLGGRHWDRASGCFELSPARGAHQLRFSCIELKDAGATYHGYSVSAEAGKVELLLFHDTEEFLLSGPLSLGKPGAEAGGPQQQSR